MFMHATPQQPIPASLSVLLDDSSIGSKERRITRSKSARV